MLARARFSVDPYWAIEIGFASFLPRRGGRFFAFTPKQRDERYFTMGSLHVPWFGVEWTYPKREDQKRHLHMSDL